MPKRFYLLLTLATLVGAFLRLWQLTAVPPGLHYDLAATALLGNEVAFNGYRPIFISAYTGHEVLFYYWLALWFRLVGSSIFTLRLAAATLGILTIPATFFALRQVLRHDEHALPLAALGATLLATAFFHVTFSRFGFRVISEPLVQALAVGFLLRGLHRISNFKLQTSNLQSPFSFLNFEFGILDLALSGLFTGLAAYTYLAARLFPIPLAIFWLALLLAGFQVKLRLTHYFGNWLLGFGIFSATAALTFAPLGLYFLQHPQDFLTRAAQVAPRPGDEQLVLQGFRRALEMLCLNGEPYDRYNLPGLPLLPIILGPFFLLGLLLTLRDLLSPAHLPPSKASSLAILKATSLLLLTWLPAFLLPTALAVHEIFPSTTRAFGLVPLLFVFPARGLLAAYRWAQSKWPGPLIPHAYPVSIFTLILLSLGALTTTQNYFFTWANLPTQRLNNDGDLTAIASYLNARDWYGRSFERPNTALYVSAIHYRHPTLAYLARDFDSIHWLFGGLSLAFPSNQDALILVSASTPLPDEWLAGWQPLTTSRDFTAYFLPAGTTPPLPPFAPLNENFGNAIFLTGVRRGVQLNAPTDGLLTLDLLWHIENPLDTPDYIPFIRLYDAWGNLWATSGGFNYPSEQWTPGDTLLTRVTVPLPPGLPPGQYTPRLGLYSESTQTNLPHLNGALEIDLPSVTLTPTVATSLDDYLAFHGSLTPPARPLDPQAPVALLGYTLSNPAPRQGEKLNLTLHWQATAPLALPPLTLALNDQLLLATYPVHNTFPFSLWSPSQLLTDRYNLKLPADFPPGPADLTLTLPGQGTATLTTLNVQVVERVLAPPTGVITTGAVFSDAIALYGYTFGTGTLTLFWQSRAALDSDYTVFVHVLDPAGNPITQRDATPRAGAYPTSLWVPGEYIADAYTFDLAPGTYQFEIGLYLPETGQRLPLADSSTAFIWELAIP